MLLAGRPISGPGPRHCVRAGIGRTFQTTRLFSDVDACASACASPTASATGAGRSSAFSRGRDHPRRLGLADALDRPCASLTSAAQRLAMIATALSTATERAAARRAGGGHGSRRSDRRSARAIRRVRDDLGLGVIVVDHNMHFLMPLADTVT